ncbi:hypothetical protein [Sulfurimonas sp. HSL3-7]|uniref:hypothetical protein n=1 Tax=Sulfonitrofixus jiaomeiensis TaxID=3131938 RepID=UPI0031F825A5
MKYTAMIALLAMMLFSGCARLNSIARDFNVNDGNGQLIDAKQRAIIVVQNESNRTVVCSEPSPDALSAYAMQLALEGKIPEQAALKLATSSQEGTSFIGLRTQSIQLLRDAMYRNCEAYANGALDKAQYGIAARRYQRSMIALLAIEQLTGTVRVPPVTITTVGTTEVAKSISEMQAEVDTIQKEIDKLTEEIKQVEDTNTTGKTDDEINILKTKQAELENQKFSRELNKKAINEGMANARGLITTGQTSAMVVGDSIIHRSDDHINEVASTVYKIFENINEADDFTQICLSYLAHNKNINNSFVQICTNRLQEVTNAVKIKIQASDALLNENIRMLSDQNCTKQEKARESLEQLLNNDFLNDVVRIKK